MHSSVKHVFAKILGFLCLPGVTVAFFLLFRKKKQKEISDENPSVEDKKNRSL